MEGKPMTTTVRIRLVIVAATLALLAAACGSEEPSETAAGDTATGPTEAATGATATGPTGEDTGGGYGMGDGGGGDGDGGSAAASVQANNFSFDPGELEVASGDELEVRNGNANTPHTFTVDGTDVDVELTPLGSETVEIDLDPGEYEFLCRFHPQMTGTLTVT
jgi:plastocyanin